MEYSQLEPVVQEYEKYLQATEDKTNALEMLEDPEMKELAQEELRDANVALEQLESTLQVLLLPKDPNDDSNIFLNIGEHGGYKEAIIRIIGTGAYSRLKFESGVHRVQRVPETESQGRVHTSAAAVAIMPEINAVEAQEIKSSDIRVDTFRASGAGGQHVNKTDSAIRITHLPTGTVVECQDERSQHKNRARAMSLLQSRILEAEKQVQHDEQAEARRSLVGSGDRSERIRTYNFPQSRVTDHRINLTLYKLDEVIAGSMDSIIDPLINEHQADLLAAMADQG